MQLSDEQKQRIIEEEQLKAAEQQFREQVRNTLVQPTVVPHSSRPQVTPPLENSKHRLVYTVSALIGVALLAFLFGTHAQSLFPNSSREGTSVPPVERKSGSTVPQKLSTSQIAEKVIPSVVVVENYDENGEKRGQGSGYVYTDGGVIATNYHVVRGAARLAVRLRSGDSNPVESLLGYDIANDVALLRVAGGFATPLPTESEEGTIKVGDRVVAVGAPLGLESTVSEGIVSALRLMGETQMIQTNTSISPGSSGGPLVNEYGKVIGLTTMHRREGQNLNFAVSARHIERLFQAKRRIEVSEMLMETHASIPIAVNTFMVGARSGTRIPIVVPIPQGGVLEGRYEIQGGAGDLDVALLTAGEERSIINSGRVFGTGQIKVRLPMGQYSLVFSNQFSILTPKSVSPEFRLSYYK